MSFEIVINPGELQRKVNEVLIRKLDNRFNTQSSLEFAKGLVEKTIVQSAAWQSLSSTSAGSLGADFGFRPEEVQSRLQGILDIWINNIKITKKVQQKARTFTFNIRIYGIRADFADVIGIKEAIVKNFHQDKERPNPDILPWLDWLVLRGDTTIIQKYGLKYGTYGKNRSRSGSTIMTPNGSFSVNPQFSGIQGENFVTKAIKVLRDSGDFKDIIYSELIRALK